MPGDTTTTTKASNLFFYLLWGSTQLMGLHAVLLIAILYNAKLFDGGYNWTTSPFSYHPTMMTVGMLFCYGNAILLYRTFTETPKFTVKLLHAILLVVSFIFAAIGLAAIIRSKNTSKPPRSHFMSFHSWIGIATFILFAFQWVCGFISFLYPQLSLFMRQRYMPR
jgi:cytochrome b-561